MHRKSEVVVAVEPCLGHRIIVAADGHIALADHDIRAERAVVALGADASPCYRLAVAIMTGDTHGVRRRTADADAIGYAARVDTTRYLRRYRRDRPTIHPHHARVLTATGALERLIASSVTIWLATAGVRLRARTMVTTYWSTSRVSLESLTHGVIDIQATLRDAIAWWRSGKRGAHLPGGWQLTVVDGTVSAEAKR